MALEGPLMLDTETLRDIIGGGGGLSPENQRVLIIATNAGGQAMTLSRDTVILGVTASATGPCQLAVGDVALYVAGNYGVDDPNIIAKWQQNAGSAVPQPCRYPIKSGTTIVFRSTTAAQICSIICTA